MAARCWVLCCRCYDCCLQNLHKKKQRRRFNYFAIKRFAVGRRTLSFCSSRIARDVRSPTQITVSFYGYLKMHKRTYNASFFFACLEVIFQHISAPPKEITVMARWGKVEFKLHGASREFTGRELQIEEQTLLQLERNRKTSLSLSRFITKENGQEGNLNPRPS